MKAVIFDGKLEFRADYPVPVPGPGEALIRVSTAGICNTDMEIIKGYAGFRGVIGHEFVGIVEAVNGNDRDLLGKRVVGEINCSCGSCPCCLSGAGNHCPSRTVLGIVGRNGAMAERVTLPANNLLVVPEYVSDREAVFTEPLAAAFEILQQLHIKPTHRILVLGDGKLGLLCALALSLTQADVTLCGKHSNKLNIAAAKGIKTVLLDNLHADRAYDIVVEATGSASGFQAALWLVKPRGTVVLKSTVAAGTEVNLSPVVIDEIHVMGSRCGPFAPALRALERGLIDVKPLVSGAYPFDQAEEAFRKTAQRESLKLLITF